MLRPITARGQDRHSGGERDGTGIGNFEPAGYRQDVDGVAPTLPTRWILCVDAGVAGETGGMQG